MTFLNYFISGISLGSIYAIIALGYTMVYGIAKMLNFAHGDVIMIGAYVCFYAGSHYGLSIFLSVVAIIIISAIIRTVARMLNFAYSDALAYVCFFVILRYGLDPFSDLLSNLGINSLVNTISSYGLNSLLGIILAVITCTFLGIMIEKFAYKPLRQAPSLAVLITAIGVSYLLQNSALLIWSPNPKVFPSIVGHGAFKLFDGELSISYVTALTIITCLIIMIVLTLFINKTKLGKAMRACSEDKGAAQLMGINVNATISMTFAIGSGLAAIAGALLCSAYPTLMPTTGALPGIKAFTAAVFGGIGSIPGAFLGGLMLGVIEIFAKAYISSQLSDAVVFAVLIIVLLVKPAGLLGKYTQEKV
ncbi:MAG: branched-chain amino acid ABC transporter permease [Synergistaceae bacterium]|nr:branched-chain amino acid ABC transporter permease [Synergistaceae bacterium]